MFEVIISQVSNGRVQRRLFDTHQEAERHVARFEEQITNPMGTSKPRSLREYRIEIQVRDVPRRHALVLPLAA